MWQQARLWITALGCVAMVLATVMVWRGWTTAGFVIALGTLIVVGAVGIVAGRQRKRAFEQHYGSLDAFRAGLDGNRLRSLRDTEGQVAAIRELRREHPELTLAQSVDVVREL
ncbi:MAG: hypothetical protein HOQ36_20420 [Nocardia sp.]|nr:hypothetical protein [Nocardia sp.]